MPEVEYICPKHGLVNPILTDGFLNAGYCPNCKKPVNTRLEH